jgi:hypothetical protein
LRICTYQDIPKEFRPKTPLEASTIKDMDWEKAPSDIAAIVIPTFASLPFGTIIITTSVFDDDFIEDMHKISNEHSFWAKSMADVIDQAVTENETDKIVKKLMFAAAPSKSCNPTRAATKGIKNITSASSGPFIDTSLVGTSFEAEQAIVK